MTTVQTKNADSVSLAKVATLPAKNTKPETGGDGIIPAAAILRNAATIARRRGGGATTDHDRAIRLLAQIALEGVAR